MSIDLPSRTAWRRGVVAAIAATALLAQAQMAAPLPPMKNQGAARYVCGGIGSDESTAMRAAMKDFPLSLLFARADGAYLADVEVAIKDAGGATALALRANGPVCLIDLPAGKYTIEATSPGGGAAKRETVSVGGGSKTADFRF